jgi:outer membrane lipoprotein-sorting protein
MPVPSARIRWLVPAGVAAAVAAAGGVVALHADAAPALPPRSAAQLLVDLQGADVTGLSGTVVQNASLGLPALPRVPGAADLTSLVSGSNTLRVWYAGPGKVRLALIGTLGETDLIRNQRDLWTWYSDRNTYTHTTLPAGTLPAAGHRVPTPAELPVTPQQAADRALALVGKSTYVSTDGTASVAHRKAYELVLMPRDTRSLVGQVRIAVDAEKSVPLRVRIFAKGANQPSFEVGFTQISFATPGEEQFRFIPPRGSSLDTGGPGMGGRPGKVGGRTQVLPAPGQRTAPERPAGAAGEPKVVGSGWTTVVVLPTGDTTAGPAAGGQLAAVLGQLPRVSGAWGSGRELRGKLFTAVLTDDGRLAIGAVGPDLVHQALGAR